MRGLKQKTFGRWWLWRALSVLGVVTCLGHFVAACGSEDLVFPGDAPATVAPVPTDTPGTG